MAKTTKREPITREDACMMMHTALRKCCDSKPTSVMYNAIHLICALEIKPRNLDPWLVFGELVAEIVNTSRTRIVGGDVKDAANKLDDAWWERNKKRKERDRPSPDNAQPSMYMMTSVFRMFDANDWDGMAAYLNPED